MKDGGAEGSSPKRQARRAPGDNVCHCTGGSARWRTSKMRFSDLSTRWIDGVAKTKKEWNSRRCSKPITESTSAEVRKTPATGEPVDSSAGGASCGVTRTCDR